MRVLFIAPLPPPITGHSVASRVLLEHLEKKHRVAVINLSTASSHDGALTWRRVVAVAKDLYRTWKEKREANVFYLTISESFFGNIKDLLIYSICYNKLNKFYIHLHGGSIKQLLFDTHPTLRRLNAIFIRRMAGVIISGQSHVAIFEEMLDPKKIHIIPNFAQDYLFIDNAKIDTKFHNLFPLNILYISGMTRGKGYLDLLNAYHFLEEAIRECIHIDFAGKFDSDEEQSEFIHATQGLPGLTYHGVVDDVRKQELFFNSHVFCLPTSYFEGQPISILEAYASANAVMTTGQAGIRDIFTDGVNGFEIGVHDAASIGKVIRNLVSNPTPLVEIAIRNRDMALLNYRTAVFGSRIEMVLAGCTAPEFDISTPIGQRAD
ncbi:hypothetical protein GETHOR_25660 [Geothrix oryzae]|uniref:Glycosyl transferase family 1 domain-containing protein n=1 Tax=Geothrix oryzae TaxID=2927975 RepID=A0ABN6V227_9BACT|nr:glycosyltransferase family 4 protein [Geothrix oryzae]BDU70465.1 hypothetical protein GETHOR_25660 [Geothrix oryzae]